MHPQYFTWVYTAVTRLREHGHMRSRTWLARGLLLKACTWAAVGSHAFLAFLPFWSCKQLPNDSLCMQTGHFHTQSLSCSSPIMHACFKQSALLLPPTHCKLLHLEAIRFCLQQLLVTRPVTSFSSFLCTYAHWVGYYWPALCTRHFHGVHMLTNNVTDTCCPV